jgi:GSH-dependent disulfide-bond oxidoreductase
MSEILREWAPSQSIEELFGRLTSSWSTNSPTAGARVQEALPAGDAPLQLYSLATPNGWKVGIMLEELEVDYDAFGKNDIRLPVLTQPSSVIT